MINTSLKITAAIILTGLVSIAYAQMSEDEQCKQMATYADRSLFEELHKQGKCLNIKLGKSPSEVEERRQVKANAKPDLSKMSQVGPNERNCIITLTQNRPLSETPFCNQPESYYRDLMAGRVNSKELEKLNSNPSMNACTAQCGNGYVSCYEKAKSQNEIRLCSDNRNQCIESCRAKYKN
jgi:hypothetical protein